MKVEIDFQNKKIELIQWLSTLEDKFILNKIIQIKKEENGKWANSVSTEEKVSIKKGLNDAKAGKLNPHMQARKIYEKWL